MEGAVAEATQQARSTQVGQVARRLVRTGLSGGDALRAWGTSGNS
jgi:hypothetical protein